MVRQAVVVTHRNLPGGLQVVRQTLDQLARLGFHATLVDDLPMRPLGASGPHVPEGTEIVVVLGGDGTILGAAELTEGTDVPILGINMGHVGFLAEFESFQLTEALERIAARDYQIESRALADVTVERPEQEPLKDWALNDATIEKTDRGKMVELAIDVDGVEVSSFDADGAIISSPTGSTAYAFSAGGPIIWPTLRTLELVPLAAHALFARPLIIGPESKLRVGILPASYSTGWITCDGRRSVELPVGSSVTVSVSSTQLRLAHLSEVPFTQRLVTKFDLPLSGWRRSAEDRCKEKRQGIAQNMAQPLAQQLCHRQDSEQQQCESTRMKGKGNNAH